MRGRLVNSVALEPAYCCAQARRALRQQAMEVVGADGEDLWFRGGGQRQACVLRSVHKHGRHCFASPCTHAGSFALALAVISGGGTHAGG